MAETELHKRNRLKKKPGVMVVAKEPPMTRKGLLAHPGSIVMGLAGMLFVSYVYNLGGMQVALDGYLGGLDHATKSHGAEVTKYFLFVLPFAGVLIGAAILYIVLSALGSMVMSPVKEARKKKAKAAAKAAKAAAMAEHGKVEEEPEAMAFVRPARLDRKEVGRLYAAKARGSALLRAAAGSSKASAKRA